MKSRNYRLFFFGQGISLIGTWIQRVAMSWLVYRITNSAMLLGTVEFVGMLPTFLLAPFTGVLADRWNRHTMMLGTQIGFTLSALALGLLVVTEIVQVWHILVLSAISGIVMAFDVPARQSLVVDMVEDKRDLGNAIALNSTMFNGARLVGPSIAGLVIAAFGEWVCFFINAATFVGYRIAGTPGACLATLSVVLAPLALLVSFLFLLSRAPGDLRRGVERVRRALRPAVSGMLLAAFWVVARPLVRDWRLLVLSALLLLLCAGGVGALLF